MSAKYLSLSSLGVPSKPVIAEDPETHAVKFVWEGDENTRSYLQEVNASGKWISNAENYFEITGSGNYTISVKAKGYASNAANFDETHAVVAEIQKEFGSIDILVNNAGITKDGLMMRMSEAQWDAVLTVNLKSAFNFIHACTPIMMKQKSGSIINMSSVVGVSGNAGQANYSASKAGMIGLAKSIAKELGSRGIRANAIAPGFIETDMTHALTDEQRAKWAEIIPMRRGGSPDEVAKVALFLASDLSSYVSGQVIHCCGGMNC